MGYAEEHCEKILNKARDQKFENETRASRHAVDTILRKVEEFFPEDYDLMYEEIMHELKIRNYL